MRCAVRVALLSLVYLSRCRAQSEANKMDGGSSISKVGNLMAVQPRTPSGSEISTPSASDLSLFNLQSASESACAKGEVCCKYEQDRTAVCTSRHGCLGTYGGRIVN